MIDESYPVIYIFRLNWAFVEFSIIYPQCQYGMKYRLTKCAKKSNHKIIWSHANEFIFYFVHFNRTVIEFKSNHYHHEQFDVCLKWFTSGFFLKFPIHLNIIRECHVPMNVYFSHILRALNLKCFGNSIPILNIFTQ